MGFTSWLPFSSSSGEAQRAEEVRAGVRAPDRTERKRCWEARDQYFACLDRNNILDALKDEKATAKACGAETAIFERDCAREWVSFGFWVPVCRYKQLFYYSLSFFVVVSISF